MFNFDLTSFISCLFDFFTNSKQNNNKNSKKKKRSLKFVLNILNRYDNYFYYTVINYLNQIENKKFEKVATWGWHKCNNKKIFFILFKNKMLNRKKKIVVCCCVFVLFTFIFRSQIAKIWKAQLFPHRSEKILVFSNNYQ